MQRARADAALYTAQVARDERPRLAGRHASAATLLPRLVDAVSAVAELPAGVPSSVLARRPDVLQAERQLRAANASIGAARAAFFPRITLTASAGTASSTLDGLFGLVRAAGASAPTESADLQRRRAARQPRCCRSTAGHQRRHLREDHPVGLPRGRRRSRRPRHAGRAARRRTPPRWPPAGRPSGSEARYRNGIDSYLGLLDAQRSLYSAQQELIGVRLSEASNRVTLYKVLGGG